MSVISGKAITYEGTPADKVVIFDWTSGKTIGTIVPNADGEWNYTYALSLNCGIIYIADNYAPITHGPYTFKGLDSVDYVEFVGSSLSMDRQNTTNDIQLRMPLHVSEHDIMVIGVMHRSLNVTVFDDNEGDWIKGPSAFSNGSFQVNSSTVSQGCTIYYRYVKAIDKYNDIITIRNNIDNSRLIAYLSVYRGRYAPLSVIREISNPLRYDDTYKDVIKNLTPIVHNGGFIIRLVSHIWVSSPYMKINGMTNIGPIGGEPARIQMGYKYLPVAGVLYDTYHTSVGDAAEFVPDVAIILGET